ncbi:recombinase family protein [Kribbella sp. NPDC051770]|uniref:recombinase family protein n=1 Tax=Kribbella sp. NPDC051770 TaxID=3155413 RepID=UPI0034299637
MLAIDEIAAPVVERIFGLYLEGLGIKAIAAVLNFERVPCPSAHTPSQNRHRKMDGWQHSTVRAILDNPRYTGYAIYGRWQKVEELLDPDDVAAGHVVRFRRSAQAKIVRSREPAHPAIVSVEDFTRVQLVMRSRRGAGPTNFSKRERTRVAEKRVCVFRSTIRCSRCGRKMEAAPRSHAIFYRCAARSLLPEAKVALEHPPTVYVREDHLTRPVNKWIARLFSPAHLADTVDALVGAEEEDESAAQAAEARRRIAEAEATMKRLQRALEAGWDPDGLTSQYNAAALDKRAAEAAMAAIQPAQRLTAGDVTKMIAELGDMARVLDSADREDLAELYKALGLAITYDDKEKRADVSISPRVVKVGVRGGT